MCRVCLSDQKQNDMLSCVGFFVLSFNSYAFAAGGDGGSSEDAYYDDAVKLIKRAGTYEKKDKQEKAKKLYSQAFKKLTKHTSLIKKTLTY